MQRAGHVILDGVVDPESWASFKVTPSEALSGTLAHLFQVVRPPLIDAEKTYSAFADRCAASGKARCGLIDFIGGYAKGSDIRKLIDDGQDVRHFSPYRGYVSNTSTPSLDLNKVVETRG